MFSQKIAVRFGAGYAHSYFTLIAPFWMTIPSAAAGDVSILKDLPKTVQTICTDNKMVDRICSMVTILSTPPSPFQREGLADIEIFCRSDVAADTHLNKKNNNRFCSEPRNQDKCQRYTFKDCHIAYDDFEDYPINLAEPCKLDGADISISQGGLMTDGAGGKFALNFSKILPIAEQHPFYLANKSVDGKLKPLYIYGCGRNMIQQ